MGLLFDVFLLFLYENDGWNERKSLPDSLRSPLDLRFIVLDTADKELDRQLAEGSPAHKVQEVVAVLAAEA